MFMDYTLNVQSYMSHAFTLLSLTHSHGMYNSAIHTFLTQHMEFTFCHFKFSLQFVYPLPMLPL